MTTKTIDPLEGLPTATAKPARQRKPAAAAASSGVTTIAEGRARLKRKRLTGEDYRNAVTFARSMTGYDDTSPIWGKRMPVVLIEVADALEAAEANLSAGDYVSAAESIARAKTYNTELQKRLATGQMIKAQS